MSPNPPSYNGLPICCTMSSKCYEFRNWKRSKVVPAWACGPGGYAGHGGLTAATAGMWASIMREEECLQPGETGLWERVPRIFSASQSNSRPGGGAESVERSRSPGGAGRSGAVGGFRRCQWAAVENTWSFRNHWQVYRGLVPADSAFSDLKWRESFLSLKSLLHPTVQRSKTIRHHKQTAAKEHDPDGM